MRTAKTIGLLCLVLGAICLAQEPFHNSLVWRQQQWGSSAAPFTPATISTYWWVYTDLATNVSVTNWVDRKFGVAWTNSAAASTQPTNTDSGVKFVRTYSQRLTNAVANQIWFSTNSSQWIIIKRDLNNTFCDFLAETPAGSSVNWGYDNTSKNFFNIQVGSYSDGTAPLSTFYDMCVLTYSNTYFVLFTNGIPAYTNTTVGVYGNWRYLGGAANGYFTGEIKELAVATNGVWTLSQVNKLHTYGTALYGY